MQKIYLLSKLLGNLIEHNQHTILLCLTDINFNGCCWVLENNRIFNYWVTYDHFKAKIISKC